MAIPPDSSVASDASISKAKSGTEAHPFTKELSSMGRKEFNTHLQSAQASAETSKAAAYLPNFTVADSATPGGHSGESPPADTRSLKPFATQEDPERRRPIADATKPIGTPSLDDAHRTPAYVPPPPVDLEEPNPELDIWPDRPDRRPPPPDKWTPKW